MCRNIRVLFHFEPPSTREEVAASALQYVRKLSGMNKPSRRNQAAFDRAVQEVTAATLQLFDALEAQGPPRTREDEQARAVERGKKREEQLRARVLKLSAAEARQLVARPSRSK
jgi:hypothetical protein